MHNSNDVKSIFLTAVEKGSPAERNAYLNGACGGDAPLRQRVEALLRAHDDPDSGLEKPAAGASPSVFAGTLPMPPETEAAGSLIGHFKLLQQIGEGGFGVVYLAEQQEPVRRRVALKIIKPGMDSRQVIARFEAERQALAMMEHQNIARVLDAGTTAAGRPYFVMELVKGVPITEYCDKNKLTPRERLELFIPVCRAIQHAHQKGVIHRDIKPSNVLVCMYDGQPVAKVIDFGVAKAIEQRLTERTMFTQHGQVMGTLEYMSPEQAELSQLDIDTRSDIYSLGVLLYELLTGTTPITKKELLEAGFVEMLRMIREKEPERPSTRLSHSQEAIPTISAQRRTEPAKLSTLLRGELDWIVMKALEKDRTRRYETANGLALDIQRYLDDEPVQACPPSAGYRLRKFVRKHRTAIMIAATFAVVLIVAAAVSTWQWREAEAARREAVVKANAEMQAREGAERSKQAEADAREKAEAESDAKGKALRQADALRLTAQSSAILQSNPGLALLLAIEGAKRAAPRQSEHNDALLAALNQCRELRTIAAPLASPNVEIPSWAHLDPCPTITAVSVSHDGRWIAGTSERKAGGSHQSITWDDKLTRVWDAGTGARRAEFTVPGLIPATVEFSPDDRFIVTTFQGAALVHYADGGQVIYSDRAARVWDAATGREVAVLKGHADRIVTAHFSRDGKRIVTASWDKTARVWDAASGKPLAVLQGDRFSLASASFSADGSKVLTVSSGGFGQSKAETPAGTKGKVEFDAALPAGPSVKEVKSLFNESGGGRVLASGHEYSAAGIWDAAAGRQLHVLGEVEPGGLDPGSGPGAVSFHFSSADLPPKEKEETISAAFSPDGKYVATGSWQGTVTIWDAETGKSVRSWKASATIGKRIQALEYSRDGTQLLLVYTSSGYATDGMGDEVAVCSTNGREPFRWGGFPTGVRAARFSPDGRRVLIVPGNEDLKKRTNLFPGSNGELVLASPEDRTVYLRDAEHGGDVALFKGHEGEVLSAEFCADGSEVVTAGEDGTVRIWNAGDRRQYGTVLPGHAGVVAEAVFSPGGHTVMTAFGLRHEVVGAVGGDRSVRIWNSDTGTLLRTLKADLGLSKPATLKQPPAKGSLLGAMRGLVGLRSAEQTAENTVSDDQILGAVRHAEFSRDGSRLLTVSDDNCVCRADDAPAGQKVLGGDGLPGSPVDELSTGASVRFAPVRVWDVASGKLLASMSGLKAGVRFASLSPDGHRIVTVTDNTFRCVWLDAKDHFRGSGSSTGKEPVAAVRVWDADSGRQIAVLLGPDAYAVCGAAWSPDGKLLFTAGDFFVAKKRVRMQLWDAATLRPVRELPSADNATWYAGRPVFSPDSRRVLLVRTDGDERLVTIWEVDGGQKQIVLRGHEGRVNEAAFSPDGKWVVTAANDGTARVWNAATGEQLFKVGDGRSPMHSAAFSPDGRWIVTASDDSSARVWYAESGREYFTLSGHRGPVYCAGFSPDSQRVITASGDGTARIWPIDPLPAAESRKPRELTDHERGMFLSPGR
jgi:eukaryotic-like serine/threonine-protein kinase